MISKVFQKVEQSGFNKLIRKSFQRNLQSIDTVSAYIDNKLYYRKWELNEYGKKKIFAQSYAQGEPIKNSKFVLDYYA